MDPSEKPAHGVPGPSGGRAARGPEKGQGRLPLSIEVEPAFAGLPVLDYLGILWPDRSKEGLRGLFARGGVRAGGRPVSPEARAGECGSLEVHADPEGLPRIHLAPGEGESGVTLLHQDDRLSALWKPAGVPVVPDRARAGPSCLGFLVERELRARSGKAPASYVRERVAHRLDRLTSGVVLFARTLEAEIALGRMFERGEIEKEYLALLAGEVLPARISVNVAIAEGRKGKMRASSVGKPSLTDFQVLERFRGFTLARAFPRTGRTHQIRVHAWAMGHPLAVDPLYRVGAEAAGPPPPGIDRLTLHAARVTLPAGWGEPREFRAELPSDFRRALELLRAGGG